jgi:hypothetical protein
VSGANGILNCWDVLNFVGAAGAAVRFGRSPYLPASITP